MQRLDDPSRQSASPIGGIRPDRLDLPDRQLDRAEAPAHRQQEGGADDGPGRRVLDEELVAERQHRMPTAELVPCACAMELVPMDAGVEVGQRLDVGLASPCAGRGRQAVASDRMGSRRRGAGAPSRPLDS